jgi:imidazolonepropionase-like amidohydrolase
MGYILNNARVIDGTGGVLEDRFIVIEDTRIRELGPRDDLPPTPTFPVIDVAGRTVLPGIIDCHVHLAADGIPESLDQVIADPAGVSVLRMARNARRTIAAGVTTVRDCGAKDHLDFAFRRAVAEGVVETAPRLVLCGRPITMTGGHCWRFARESNGADELRKAAREQLRAGADCIKLMATGGIVTEGQEISSPQLGEAEMRAAVEEAHHAGKISAAHAHGATGVKNAVRAGITSIEHAYFLDDEGIELMLRHGTYLVPTSAAVKLVVRHGTEAGIPCWAVAKAASALDSHAESCLKAYKAGVKMAMGTDCGTPYNRHGENLQELEALVEVGLDVMDVIKMATNNAAHLLGLGERIGTVESGKEADLLVVDGDPLADIALLKDPARIAYVFQAGVMVHGDHASLRAA